MPVTQANFWCCEVCGLVVVRMDDVDPYGDPVVVPPDVLWEYIGPPENERLACPACFVASGWMPT